MRDRVGIDHGAVKDGSQAAFGLDFLVIAGDVCDIEAQGQRLRIILDRASDDRSGNAQILADDALDPWPSIR